MKEKVQQIPSGERPVDFLMSLAKDKKRPRVYRNLSDARSDPEAVVIFEGDWGGTVFATCPLKIIPDSITDQDLRQLGLSLEKSFWDCNCTEENPDGGYGVYYKALPPGSGVLGGMGGGLVEEGLWVHPELGSRERHLLISGLKL